MQVYYQGTGYMRTHKNAMKGMRKRQPKHIFSPKENGNRKR